MLNNFLDLKRCLKPRHHRPEPLLQFEELPALQELQGNVLEKKAHSLSRFSFQLHGFLIILIFYQPIKMEVDVVTYP